MSPHDRRAVFAAVVAAAALCGVIALVQSSSSDDSALAAESAAVVPAAEDVTKVPGTPALAPDTTLAGVSTTLAPGSATTAPGSETTDVPDLDGDALTTEATCTMTVLSLRHGEANSSVGCLQKALTSAGFYTGPISGSFDQATFDAVERLQSERKLYVDGIVGRETAISLAIWPDEESLVIRTPKPAPGSVDLLGYTLSSVATSGPDAPPLPENSGNGKRLVYDRAGQRVWAVDSNERVIRSWLVAGSKYSNEMPGTHQVYSKSEVSTAWNGAAYLPLMVRWLKTEKGAIGFHGIPIHVEDNSPYMTDAELGTRLSGGCQRQSDLDAKFVWDFADIGTTVVVL